MTPETGPTLRSVANMMIEEMSQIPNPDRKFLPDGGKVYSVNELIKDLRDLTPHGVEMASTRLAAEIIIFRAKERKLKAETKEVNSKTHRRRTLNVLSTLSFLAAVLVIWWAFRPSDPEVRLEEKIALAAFMVFSAALFLYEARMVKVY